jgi:hypothetical protein
LHVFHCLFNSKSEHAMKNMQRKEVQPVPQMTPLRYVVLRHEGIAEPHFDLMLEVERGGPLCTWRVPRWPLDRFYTSIEEIDRHRNSFLQYEGPVSKGRGSVTRIESGACPVRVIKAGAIVIGYDIQLPDRTTLYLLRNVQSGRDPKSRKMWRGCRV